MIRAWFLFSVFKIPFCVDMHVCIEWMTITELFLLQAIRLLTIITECIRPPFLFIASTSLFMQKHARFFIYALQTCLKICWIHFNWWLRQLNCYRTTQMATFWFNLFFSSCFNFTTIDQALCNFVSVIYLYFVLHLINRRKIHVTDALCSVLYTTTTSGFLLGILPTVIFWGIMLFCEK